MNNNIKNNFFFIRHKFENHSLIPVQLFKTWRDFNHYYTACIWRNYCMKN